MSGRIVISFDLDFTLIDNKEGILNSFNYAFNTCGDLPVEDAILEKTIGEPLENVFKRLSTCDPYLLTRSFREYYRKEGLYKVRLYKGVPDLLTTFKREGIILGVSTSKKKELAIKLLKYLSIYHFFDFVIGETEKIKRKTDPLVKKLFYSRYPPDKCNYIIVGDHTSDKGLAEMLECPFIGLLTGHSSEDVLKSGSRVHTEVLHHVSEISLELIKMIIKDNNKDKRKKVKN